MECREGDWLTVACDIYEVCVCSREHMDLHVCTQPTHLQRSESESRGVEGYTWHVIGTEAARTFRATVD